MRHKFNTNQDLLDNYIDLNSSYFNNKLLKDIKIHYGKPIRKNSLATTRFTEWQDELEIEIIIKNDRCRVGREIALTLIHEMIHVKFYCLKKVSKKYDCDPPKRGDWGKSPWSKEVRRLARL